MQSRQYIHRALWAMGTQVNFWIDSAAGAQATAALRTGEIFIRDFDRRLSRFNPASELCALNQNPAETVPVSTLLARLVEAAIEAAQISGGLVDPTLVGQLERAGYSQSRAGEQPAELATALAHLRSSKPASPSPESRWREITVDLSGRTVTRPVGVRIDSGGVGKGLAADMLAALWRRLLPSGTAFIIDCGGDMRLGELSAGSPPYEINVNSGIDEYPPVVLELWSGGVATSGIGRRIWRSGDGWAHHLIDPSTGDPAWTGLSSATATGATALEAETAAKVALLRGSGTGALPSTGELITANFAGEITHYSQRQEARAA